MQHKSVKLESIELVHPKLFDAFQACKICNNVIVDRSLFSAKAVLTFLKIKPLIICKSDQAGYLLVAGFREWQLAQMLVPLDTKVDCRLVNENTDSIQELAWSDAYMTSILLSIHPTHFARQLSTLSKSIPISHIKKFHPKLGNINQLSMATGLNNDSFYPKANKRKIPDFGDFMKGR